MRLEALAEQHRAATHPWCKRGRVHRVALEPHEVAEVDALLAEWAAAAVSEGQAGVSIYRGHSGSLRQV